MLSGQVRKMVWRCWCTALLSRACFLLGRRWSRYTSCALCQGLGSWTVRAPSREIKPQRPPQQQPCDTRILHSSAGLREKRATIVWPFCLLQYNIPPHLTTHPHTYSHHGPHQRRLPPSAADFALRHLLLLLCYHPWYALDHGHARTSPDLLTHHQASTLTS